MIQKKSIGLTIQTVTFLHFKDKKYSTKMHLVLPLRASIISCESYHSHMIIIGSRFQWVQPPFTIFDIVLTQLGQHTVNHMLSVVTLRAWHTHPIIEVSWSMSGTCHYHGNMFWHDNQHRAHVCQYISHMTCMYDEGLIHKWSKRHLTKIEFMDHYMVRGHQ